jgi:hypothetical protein
MNGRGKKTGLFFAGVIVATLIVEAVLVAIESTPLWRHLPVAEVALYGPDAATGYAHRAGVSGIWTTENRAHVRINDLGLRDDPMTLERPAGTRRLAVVGDSITEALQVELPQTFQHLAEEMLTARLGHPVEIANLGLAGATPAVLVERLRSRGPSLNIEGALLVMSVADLTRQIPDDISALPGYVRTSQGDWVISHAFRDGRGYRLRSGFAGRLLYLALDHLRIARILNARRNLGVLHEWPPPVPVVMAGIACVDEGFAQIWRAWMEQQPEPAAGRIAAFLRDIDVLKREHTWPIGLGLFGPEASCPADADRVGPLRAAISARLAGIGISVFFIEDGLRARLRPGERLEDLRGFGRTLGRGHFNERGHAAMADLIAGLAAALLAEADRR